MDLLNLTCRPQLLEKSMLNEQYRILQVIPAFEVGGVEQGTLDIAHALAREGHSAFIASEGGSMVQRLPQSNTIHIAMNLATKNPAKIFKNSLRLKKLIRAESIDLVHARSRAPAWSAYFAALQTDTPFITTFHAAYGHQNKIKLWLNSVMARGEALIAISDFIANHIQDHYSKQIVKRNSKIHTIHRGIDCEYFDSQNVEMDRIIKLRRKWQIPDDHQVIGLPGRLTRIKGHLPFLRAIQKLREKGLNSFTCVLIGPENPNSNYAGEIDSFITQHNLSSWVKKVGPCSDMPAANLLADVIVVPSTVPEGFGRTIAEASAMGTPVIASNLGAAPELVTHAQTGWLVPPEDHHEIACYLEKALKLPADTRKKMGDAAQAKIRAAFTKETMCEKTLKLYGEIIAKHKAGKKEAL